MKKLIQNNKNEKTLAGWSHSGRFPHAILIEGPAGSGRKTFARQIAATLLCLSPQPPCGECLPCRKVARDIHPDLLTYQGEGGARSFHVQQVRDIREQAWISPNESKVKIFLLLHTEEMTAQSQNALLKLIEEPPAGVYFILVCENQYQMLTTIRSRVTVLSMKPPTVEDAIPELERLVPDRPQEDYEVAALQSGGNIGAGLELLAQEEPNPNYQIAKQAWNAFQTRKEIEALSVLSTLDRNREGFLEVLQFLRRFVQQALLQTNLDRSRLPNSLQLSQIIDIIDKTQTKVQGNGNLLVLLTLLSAEIAEVLS